MKSSYIYDDYGVNPLKEKYNDKFFFRKTSPDSVEIEISTLLMDKPNKNIVEFYNITPEFIDMELLETYQIKSSVIYTIFNDKPKIKEIMKPVKDFLQSLGIAYIDWKIDNIGISDGTYKLFDFNMCGIFDVNTDLWITPPERGFNYKNAIKRGITDPRRIDDICFENGFH